MLDRVLFLCCLAVLVLAGFTLGMQYAEQHRPHVVAESPCVVSWDENDGDSTFCVLTRKAAFLEHTQYTTFKP